MRRTWRSALLLTWLAACTSKSDAEYRADTMASTHDSVGADLEALVQAARSPRRKRMIQ